LQEETKMRLDRALANSGYGSRSEIRKLIRLGQVTVAGEVIRDPAFPLGGPAAETVRISGQERLLHDHLTVMLNKPAGCVTAMEDSRLPTVADLLPPAWVRTGLVPVGRLDRDTTGLLLLTNDGTLNHRLASPRWGVWKIYRFRYDGPEWTPGDVAAFAAGLTLPDGRRLKPARLVPRSGGVADLMLHEGKFHQVKRMVRTCGREVTRLHRHTFGPLTLDENLAAGASRLLTADETKALRAAVQMDEPAGGS
jgi:16S rRNA pseudouridine516 synthase